MEPLSSTPSTWLYTSNADLEPFEIWRGVEGSSIGSDKEPSNMEMKNNGVRTVVSWRSKQRRVDMEVVGIFVSPLLKAVINKLLSSDSINLARRGDIDTSIKKLKKSFEDINDVLADAEDKQISDTAVNKWLKELQHLAYDADDVLDEFATEVQRKKLIMADADVGEASTSSKFKQPTTRCRWKNSPIRHKQSLHISARTLLLWKQTLGCMHAPHLNCIASFCASSQGTPEICLMSTLDALF
ncbi:putative disease resistance RPP13-like protein 1 [Camellia lanceoleosa]|uniref:Disease resistance RPP13-like protein 1 n=1 Tax=Camellia lanceoleosa TaxID=1840588 RepID=A0ACC0II98_9ERIC|nr:putative disease resistance RPP13-like protein 1 [Camellia lanceoleosa]